ncbi:hypothetical protein [Methylorubrum extorquens]|uniref:Uncharacterized protein n=1 Tax=Methylorubrum extorquens (strain ATCC 14718 / DSM 1338 / JCM 2805 / NCIMB 9133 / AM1) TaxID=272630 RepID=C5APW5_METEA|nr:hypothetical protein [Methylorubrum extorquens]ACS40000.1 hypothetical protein MexAM1_META1p2206 [Methylorubrum extorquens AM1]MCP1541857.1 hypothetical protein [Methylorubrum extorquens]
MPALSDVPDEEPPVPVDEPLPLLPAEDPPVPTVEELVPPPADEPPVPSVEPEPLPEPAEEPPVPTVEELVPPPADEPPVPVVEDDWAYASAAPPMTKVLARAARRICLSMYSSKCFGCCGTKNGEVRNTVPGNLHRNRTKRCNERQINAASYLKRQKFSASS